MNKYKKYMIISLIILVITLICTTGTYAWFTWSNPSNTNLTLTINNIDVIFNVSPDINITNLSPVLYPEEGTSTTFSLKKNNNSLGNIEYTITLDITTISDELKDTSFKWLLKQEDTILTSGDFYASTNNSSITLYTGTLTDTNTLSYILYIYIDGNNENNPNMMNKSLTGTINISGEEIQIPVNLATYITNLYTNAAKSEVTNDSITYNYATSVSLMNDRLGGTTTDYDGGNIRYYGESPNNYIYFNCSDYSNQTSDTCELWRIIGVFDGKVKLIRNESIGALAWDYDKNLDSSLTTYDNNWSTSSLQVLLNTAYFDGDAAGTIPYYSISLDENLDKEIEVEDNLNMAEIGIKNDITRSMISFETYYLLGFKSSNHYEPTYIGAGKAYNLERTDGNVYENNPANWIGRIALPYLSDYMYGGEWLYSFFSHAALCLNVSASNNYDIIIGDTDSNISYYSSVSASATYYITNYNLEAKPVLYLEHDIIISDIGNGTEDNPYRITI